MENKPPSPTDTIAQDSLDQVLAEYLRALEKGERPNREALIVRYPDLVNDLREFFENHDKMGRLAGPIGDQANEALSDFGPMTIRYFGDYEVLEEIARGGMGVVFKARQVTLNRIVAIKMILAGKLASPQDVDRFHLEAEAAAKLDHPGIVPIFEVGQHEGQHYFSMGFVEGQSLATSVIQGPMSAREAVELIGTVAQAVQYAHESGVIHRDLKPGNILLDRHGNPRVTDFGLAKIAESGSDLTGTGQILGTPGYMPPEQAGARADAVSPQSDVYSMGAILYCLLTGRPPFQAATPLETLFQVQKQEPVPPRQLNSLIPLDLETICLKCLQKEPGRRYGSAKLLNEDLQRYLDSRPILARPISRHERLWRWCLREPVVASLSLTSFLLIAAIAVVSTLRYQSEAELRRTSDGLLNRAVTGERSAKESAVELQKMYDQVTTQKNELEQAHGVTLKLIADNSTLEHTGNKLKQDVDESERHLAENLVRVARSEWLKGNVAHADQALEQCPERLRGAEWHVLKQLWLPKVEKFLGHSCVAYSPDGAHLATIGGNNTVLVWSMATRQQIHSFAGHTQSVTSISFSHDGKWLASGGTDRRVFIWSLTEGELVQTLENHSQPVSDVAFSPDGRRFASASFQQVKDQVFGELILWDRATWEEERRLPGLGRVAFSPDGQAIAVHTSVSTNKGTIAVPVVQVWNVESLWDDSAVPLLTIPAVDNRLIPAVFSPDGQAIAVVSPAKDAAREMASLDIWNLRRKVKVLEQYLPLDFQVHALAFSPDAKRLACGGRDGFSEAVSTTFKVVTFNRTTGERDRIFPWYSKTVTDLAYSRDGRQLATATSTEIKVWDVTPASDPTQVILANIPEHNVGPGDWPQWGGSRSRINTPNGKNIPIDWKIGTSGAESKNIKWVARLGSQTYGNPVVANGRIFVGTNNGSGYLSRYPSKIDLGVLLCFEEETGKFLWQHSNKKLPTGRVNDWPLQGVCSTPVIDGDKLWYVTNRGEVVCLDTKGFYDGVDDGEPHSATDNAERIFSVPAERVRSFDHICAVLVEAGFSMAGTLQFVKQLAEGNWLLGNKTRHTDFGKELIPSYEILLRDGMLRVFAVDEEGKRTTGKELFSQINDLYPSLKNGVLNDLLIEQMCKAGVKLPAQAKLTVITPDAEWSTKTEILGKTRTLLLRRRDGFLTCVKQWSADDLDEADVVWRFDMIRDLGVFPHNMSTCSMITVEGALFVCTSNGVDEGHSALPAPNAPSFIALDRATGKVLWTDNSPGKNIMHAQWASPSYGMFDGQPQVIFPGGDGWVYSFDPKGNGKGGSRLLWKFDANPKESIYRLGGRSTRNNIISFPAIYDGLVYIVVGEDPEYGEGPGQLWCLDPTKRMDGADVSAELAVNAEGEIIPHKRFQAVETKLGERAVPNPNSAARWHYDHQDINGNGKFEFEETFHRSLSIPVIKDDLLYVADFSGLFHCLNAKTGKVYWTVDLMFACWSSALLVDGHVYICTEDGTVHMFRHSSDPHIAMQVSSENGTHGAAFKEISMNEPIYMTPIVANNVLYIATRSMLYAIKKPPDGQEWKLTIKRGKISGDAE